MKIMWLSPNGDGWAAAKKLRDAGNRVVYFNPSENKNGLGYLPSVPEAAWKDYALKSDLIVVDANFPSRPTRRSFSPSDYVLDLAQVRRKGMSYIGPTPTSELFENDLRYQAKLLSRLGLSLITGDIQGTRFTVSRDPDGFSYLVFRHRHLIADENGPDIGNLGDLVIPIGVNSALVNKFVKPVEPLLERLRFNGYFNLDLVLTDNGTLEVTGITTRFLYPAIFAQLASLLGGAGQRGNLGLAVTLLRLDDNSDTSAEQVMNLPGFFGCEIHRDFDEGRGIVHGSFVGAIVGTGDSLPAVQHKVDAQLVGQPPGWGFRNNIGVASGDTLRLLTNIGLI